MNVRKTIGAATLAFAVAACLSTTEPPDPIFWEGTLSPAPGSTIPLSGQIIMVANPHNTEVGIFLQGPEDAEFSWIVRTGNCSGTGAPIAPESAFPVVRIGENGEGATVTLLGGRLARGSYAGEVFSQAGATGDVVACANITETDGFGTT